MGTVELEHAFEGVFASHVTIWVRANREKVEARTDYSG